jgi:NADH:ubiquinone reductase (H+-translocating)
MRWVLVEGEPRIVKEVPAPLAEFTTRELQRRGIEVKTGIHVDEITDRTVHLTTGETIPARTLVWTAGITPCHAVIDLGLPLAERGRIKTDPAMRVEGHRNVWAIGDAAAVPDPAQRGDPCPRPRSTRCARGARWRVTSPPRSAPGRSGPSPTRRGEWSPASVGTRASRI